MYQLDDAPLDWLIQTLGPAMDLLEALDGGGLVIVCDPERGQDEAQHPLRLRRAARRADPPRRAQARRQPQHDRRRRERLGALMQRPCVRCGVLIASGSCCPAQDPVRRFRTTPGRGGSAQITRFRTAVLEAAGYQCEAIIDGLRCEETRDLQAHHLVGLREGGSNDPDNGVALSGPHHRLVERLPGSANPPLSRRRRAHT